MKLRPSSFQQQHSKNEKTQKQAQQDRGASHLQAEEKENIIMAPWRQLTVTSDKHHLIILQWPNCRISETDKFSYYQCDVNTPFLRYHLIITSTTLKTHNRSKTWPSPELCTGSSWLKRLDVLITVHPSSVFETLVFSIFSYATKKNPCLCRRVGPDDLHQVHSNLKHSVINKRGSFFKKNN